MRGKIKNLIEEFLGYDSLSSCIGKGQDGSTLRSRTESGRISLSARHADLETLDNTTPTIQLRKRKYADRI